MRDVFRTLANAWVVLRVCTIAHTAPATSAIDADVPRGKFHVSDDADDCDAGDWVMDQDGRLYAATRLGVQVFDHNGRVRAILPVPLGAITSVAFVGPDAKTLRVGPAGHRFVRRRLNVTGARSGIATEVPNWGPG